MSLGTTTTTTIAPVCKYINKNVFHTSTYGCSLTENTHIYNEIKYSQDGHGNIHNLCSIKNCRPQIIRSNLEMSVTLTAYDFEAEYCLSYQEYLRKTLYGEDGEITEPCFDQLRITLHSLIESILELNNGLIFEKSDQRWALNPKVLFDIYIYHDQVYLFRPILMQPITADYYESWRQCWIEFFNMIGQFIVTGIIDETTIGDTTTTTATNRLTARTLKNKKKTCQLLEDHYHKKNHLNQLRCSSSSKSGAGKNHRNHMCWENLSQQYIEMSSDILATTTNVNQKDMDCININLFRHHCFFTDLNLHTHLYIGYSFLYRNPKMHTLFCTPSALLNDAWYNELNTSLRKK